MYVDMHAKNKKLRGCKQMKDKTRMTIMVCTSASGDKIPLALVGKSLTGGPFDDELVDSRAGMHSG